MISENSHTIPWRGRGGGGHLGIPQERGISWTGILKAWAVMQFGIPNAWGDSALNFQRGMNGKSFV